MGNVGGLTVVMQFRFQAVRIYWERGRLRPQWARSAKNERRHGGLCL